jgi:DNA-binding transcriptional regulator LsrR (DeoR family)
MGKKSKLRPSDDDYRLFHVVDLFFRRKSVREIAEEMELTREQVYPMLARARDRNLIRLVPPVDETVAAQIAAKFKQPRESIHVVNVGSRAGQHVAAKAASLVLELIKDVGREHTQAVTIGLGPGRGTRDLCAALSRLLAEEPEVPDLKLVAITGGCPAKQPEYAPVTFFQYFADESSLGTKRIERIGLFAETLVRARELSEIRRRPGVREAFEAKASIDIVLTSMGAFDDEHDLLRLFLKEAGQNIDDLVQRTQVVGNVQYRPFTRRGVHLERDDEWRTVSVFELADFKALAEKKDKHVVLIARQCGLCGERSNRAAALRPLLEVPELKVWSTLVLDIGTARNVLQA